MGGINICSFFCFRAGKDTIKALSGRVHSGWRHVIVFKKIRRTSSPVATDIVAIPLDELFSNESQLEIWAPVFLNDGEFQLGLDPAKSSDRHL